MNIKLATTDYPSLYQVADTASINSQNTYTRLVKADLFLIVLGAFLSSIPITDPEAKNWYNITGAIFLLIAFLISLALRFTRYERVWYGGRAVAESVKTLSWRFMMCAKPFPASLNTVAAEKLLADRLAEILKERAFLAIDFTPNTSDQISSTMKSVRQMQTDERMKIYLNERVRQQRQWYADKAKFNKDRANLFFWIAIAAQVIAFAFSVYQVRNVDALNFSSAFAACTAALFSWMQIRKFQELAQVYALSAQELSFVDARSGGVVTDKELSDFIADSESAISREHTLWIARRDH